MKLIAGWVKMTKLTISKSQYIKGLQCPKALWLSRHSKDLASEVAQTKQALFDTGRDIGDAARGYFANGVLVANEYWETEGAVEATEQYTQNGEGVIFEAAAIHPSNGCHARIDILKRVENSNQWDLIEVKGSTKLKDPHIDDVSFQYHVFNGAGYEIRKCYVMLVNSDYIRNGKIDPQKLFKLEEITNKVLAKQSEVDTATRQLNSILVDQTEPKELIGVKCSTPFECDYKNYCWVDVPDYSVYDVFSKSKVDEIASQHGFDIKALPDQIKPTGTKAIDVQSYIEGETHVDAPAISDFLRQISYPIYYLDYETIVPAIPMFDGTKPYQQIPFQFSVHIQHTPNGDLTHHEFLHKDRSDPRRAFAEKLVDLCGDTGTVLVYNQSLEKTRNKELAQDFPEYASAIQAINARIVDLLEPFRKRWLYHPDQRSSASIKAVLPCFSDLSYENLGIGSGEEAMLQYKNFIAGNIPEYELEDLWKNLSAYCEQDTRAMAILLDALKQQAHE